MNDSEWFAEHTAYLATPEWAFRRGQALNRDGYRCQARLHGCRGDASQVHHLTYKHWRNEPLFDLTSVCAACHEEITRMDRQARPPQVRVTPQEIGMDLLDDELIATDMSRRLREVMREVKG